jgi:hypothetical protein
MDLLYKILLLLELKPVIRFTERFIFPGNGDIFDLRDSINPKRSHRSDVAFSPVEYKQVFSEKHGFIANLSIIDLIFNAGDEAPEILKRSSKPKT